MKKTVKERQYDTKRPTKKYIKNHTDRLLPSIVCRLPEQYNNRIFTNALAILGFEDYNSHSPLDTQPKNNR